jgi:outer membrane biosynthesis protein TonB
MRFDRGMILSIAGHGAILAWALISFARPLESDQSALFPVDVLTADEFSQLTAGTEKAKPQPQPKPVAEKIGEAQPIEDPNAKVVPKKDLLAATDKNTPEPEPKKPDPKPAVAPPEPKTETKAADKKEPEQKVDPIAEALKKDEAKKPDKKVEKKPQPEKKEYTPQKQYTWDPRRAQEKISKQDSTRLAAAGSEINTVASLGASSGAAATLSASEIDAIRRRLDKNWNKPPGLQNSGIVVEFSIRLRPDGRLAASPQITTRGNGPLYDALKESARRAVLLSEPFDFLSPARYELWKELDLAFKANEDPR